MSLVLLSSCTIMKMSVVCVCERERCTDSQMPCLFSYLFHQVGACSPVSELTAHGVGVLSPCIINGSLREQVDKAPAHQCPPWSPIHSISQRCPPIVIYDNHQDQIAAQSLNHAGAALRSRDAAAELLTCLDCRRLSSGSNSLFSPPCKSLI